jgi:hypothetical protein
MEVQLTDFENAAFSVFIALCTRYSSDTLYSLPQTITAAVYCILLTQRCHVMVCCYIVQYYISISISISHYQKWILICNALIMLIVLSMNDSTSVLI